MRCIMEDQKKKEILERELAVVKDKLSVVCKSLDENLDKKSSIDESIANCESAYMKVRLSLVTLEKKFPTDLSTLITLFQILESSQALLDMVRQDALSLDPNHSGSFKCEST